MSITRSTVAYADPQLEVLEDLFVSTGTSVPVHPRSAVASVPVRIPIMRSETSPPAKLRPILKWAGGKRQVLPAIRPLIPTSYKRYIEPFLGGGAVLFDLAPKSSIVNDLNTELITLYEVIRDEPNELIDILASFAATEKDFYEIRSWDRDPISFAKRSAVEKAARTIYLNRTGFNGLYRVNASGQYNVPFGKYTNPKVCDKDAIHFTSEYFSNSRIVFHNEDFRRTIARARCGDFIYVDPPYAPLDDAVSTFTTYTAAGFGHQDLVDLREVLDAAALRGATWVMSNVKSRATMKLFPKTRYKVAEVQVTRPINACAEGRGAITEILVMPR
jgi:DNA adenine methylase